MSTEKLPITELSFLVHRTSYFQGIYTDTDVSTMLQEHAIMRLKIHQRKVLPTVHYGYLEPSVRTVYSTTLRQKL